MGQTLLDEVGKIHDHPDARNRSKWRSELLSQPGSDRSALLQIWLGELDLAVDEEPLKAIERFREAAKLAGDNFELKGLAAYDTAIALFYAGEYGNSRDSFYELLRGKLAGFNRRACSLFARHAAGCASIHERNAALGITQPERLDPLCGAATLAICLKELGLPYDKKRLSMAVRHTGMGSNMHDIAVGARKLGVAAHAVRATDAALKVLPKPLIAHVEHDHFITVTKVDDSSVTYYCSDCGAWPGGERKLTWKQWAAMEADGFLCIVKKNTAEDIALEQLRSTAVGPTIPFKVYRPLGDDTATALKAQVLLNSLIRANVTTLLSYIALICGNKPQSLHCSPCWPYCLLDAGPTATGDPVNLATGEEEYEPEPDLVVYNPIGPSVIWKRMYYSLGDTTPNGFGLSWSHPYNIHILDNEDTHNPPEGEFMGPLDPINWLILPNSSRIGFTMPDNVLPDAQNPSIRGTLLENGHAYIVDWKFSATDNSTYYAVTLPDRTVWSTQTRAASGTNRLFVNKITNRTGQYITLNWSNYTKTEPGWSQTDKGLSTIKDSDNVSLLTLGYDSQGRFISASDRYSRSVYYASTRYANGGMNGNPPPVSDELTTVSQVVLTGALNPPVRNSYTYENLTNRHTTQTVPYLKTISVPSPTGTGMSTATINYSTQTGYVTSTVDANGNQRIYEAPDPNKTKVVIKDSLNTVVHQYSAEFNSNMAASKRFDAADRLLVEYVYSDPNTQYYPSSITAYPDPIVDPDGITKSFTWDVYNQLVTSTSPKGTTTTYTRNYTSFPFGEVTAVQEGTKTSTTFEYYAGSGLLWKVNTPIPGQVGTGNRQTTTYTYNSFGDVLSITSPGNNATLSRTITFNYTTDGLYSQPQRVGQPIKYTNELGKVTHFRYDTRGNINSTWDHLGYTTSALYNLANQPTSITLPATGSSGAGNAKQNTIYQYPGGPTSAVHAYNESNVLFRTVSFGYGNEGELLTRAGATEPVTLEYDAAYRIKTLKDGRNNSTTYGYNSAGNLDLITYPGSQTVQYPSYDRVGNVLQRIDGNGVTTNYIYADGDGQLSDVQYPATPTQNVQLTYDNYGRMTSMTDGTGAHGHTYDDLDLASSFTTTYTGLAAKTLNYSYHADGSRSAMTTPGGNFTYNYNSAGRLMNMPSPAGTASWTYLDNNWLSTRTLPNGSWTQYLYNPVGMLTSLTNKTSGGSTLSAYSSFGYDGVFNLTGLTSSVPGAPSQGGTQTFGYDTKDRLTGDSSTRNGGYGFAFAYDDSFNPTTWKNSSGLTYNSNNQQNAGNLAYDNNGNPTNYFGTMCAFDPENRMTSFGAAMSAGYRGDGLRAWKQVGANRTYFLYDGIVPVIEMNASGTVTATNVFGDDGLVARQSGGSWTHYAFDQQGNVAQRLSASQSVTSSSTYDAYGAETITGSSTDPYGYNARWGYYFDREIGLYKCTFRDYDPTRGRWLTRDPIGYAGAVNLYGYCIGNPTFWMDPLGFGIWGTVGGVVGGLVGGIGGSLLGPGGAAAGAGLGAGLGRFLGGLADGEKPADAATAGAIDGALAAGGGFIASKCFSLLRAARNGKAAGKGLEAADDIYLRKGTGTPRGSNMAPQDPSSAPATINGRPYSGHAVGRLGSRRIPPSAVDDTILNGTQRAGRGGEIIFSGPNGTVVVDPGTGTVITIY
ncbi:MAG: RHS repeat-associated core domain-containing protein [Fimbriimonadales bacterium]